MNHNAKNMQTRCAIYTRKSNDEGLEQAYNSIDAQRDSCVAYVRSQAHEGWSLVQKHYEDGGFSGGNLKRPALKALIQDIEAGLVDLVLVYKIDRLTRSLADFARLVELFDKSRISLVSATEQFSTKTSMGRLTLNMLLSFAQYERDITGERIRDKISAAKSKGLWMGGHPPIGYKVVDRKLEICDESADDVKLIFKRYLDLGSVQSLKRELDDNNKVTRRRKSKAGNWFGGRSYSQNIIYRTLKNPVYIGKITHHGKAFTGVHESIITKEIWSAVQSELRIKTVRKPTIKKKALLAGIVVNQLGDSLTPYHVLRRGVRYQYYVSQKLLQNERKRQYDTDRLPAEELERLVLCALSETLKNDRLIEHHLSRAKQQQSNIRSLVNASKELGSIITNNHPNEAKRWIRSFLVKAIVSQNEVTTHISVEDLRLLLAAVADGEFNKVFSQNLDETALRSGEKSKDAFFESKLAYTIVRRGQSIRFVMNLENQTLSNTPNSTLIKTLARAHYWKNRIVTGQSPSIRSLARESGFDERYTARILRLAYLPPQTTEMILDGHAPPNYTIEYLLTKLLDPWPRCESEEFLRETKRSDKQAQTKLISNSPNGI